MRAALYARFSTDKQRDTSIDDQMRECERVARAAGLEVVARYEDKGISGGTAARPGYQALLAAARQIDAPKRRASASRESVKRRDTSRTRMNAGTRGSKKKRK